MRLRTVYVFGLALLTAVAPCQAGTEQDMVTEEVAALRAERAAAEAETKVLTAQLNAYAIVTARAENSASSAMKVVISALVLVMALVAHNIYQARKMQKEDKQALENEIYTALEKRAIDLLDKRMDEYESRIAMWFASMVSESHNVRMGVKELLWLFADSQPNGPRQYFLRLRAAALCRSYGAKELADYMIEWAYKSRDCWFDEIRDSDSDVDWNEEELDLCKRVLAFVDDSYIEADLKNTLEFLRKKVDSKSYRQSQLDDAGELRTKRLARIEGQLGLNN